MSEHYQEAARLLAEAAEEERAIFELEGRLMPDMGLRLEGARRRQEGARREALVHAVLHLAEQVGYVTMEIERHR